MNEPLPKLTESTAITPPANAAKLEHLRRKARRWQRVLRLAAILSPIGWLVGVGSLLLHKLGVTPPLPDWLFNVVIFSPLWMPFFGMQSLFWQAAVKEYQSHLDLQAVGLIVEGLTASDNLIYARDVLTAMLPRLQASDAHLLNALHHHILNRQMSGKFPYCLSSRAKLILATLKAYEQIGGTEDLPTVKRLARGEGYAKRNKEIRTAAQECLPYLQARSEQQESRQNLLRASQSAADSPATLLRPASAADDLAPRQLLRPSTSKPPE